jgi:hypothetical protein
MLLSQFSFPIPSVLVFQETIARAWYDGITSGFAMSIPIINHTSACSEL